MLQTQYEFTLPKGYMDEEGNLTTVHETKNIVKTEEGNLHMNGIMRLATAMDEIRAMRDPRVMQNPDYAAIIILSHVIIKLGSLPLVTVETIEKLFASDLKFLQEMYETLNGLEGPVVRVTCPYCGKEFTTEMDFKG